MASWPAADGVGRAWIAQTSARRCFMQRSLSPPSSNFIHAIVSTQAKVGQVVESGTKGKIKKAGGTKIQWGEDLDQIGGESLGISNVYARKHVRQLPLAEAPKIQDAVT